MKKKFVIYSISVDELGHSRLTEVYSKFDGGADFITEGSAEMFLYDKIAAGKIGSQAEYVIIPKFSYQG